MKIKKPAIETASIDFEFLRKAELAENEFEGMASVFNAPIMAWTPTVIEPGAFKKTLAEKFGSRTALDRVKILFNHNPELPIGRPTLLEETREGLRLRARISETEQGKDTLTLLRDGVLDSLSIGFDPVKFSFEEHEDKQTWRHIQEIRLWEVSVVTMPANAGALISDVNSIEREQISAYPLESFASFVAQTLICPKAKWASLSDAKQWLRDHDYKTDVDETEDSWRFRQRDPGDFSRLRAICINPGRDASMEDCKVKAVGGPLKDSQSLSPSLNDLAFVLAESHEGKVLSSKNKRLLSDAVAALQALIAAAEPPESKDDKQALTVNAERLNRLRCLERDIALFNSQQFQ